MDQRLWAGFELFFDEVEAALAGLSPAALLALAGKLMLCEVSTSSVSGRRSLVTRLSINAGPSKKKINPA